MIGVDWVRSDRGRSNRVISDQVRSDRVRNDGVRNNRDRNDRGRNDRVTNDRELKMKVNHENIFNKNSILFFYKINSLENYYLLMKVTK